MKADVKTYPEIGKRLRRFREKTGLSQAEFADLHGFNRGRYNHWETGARRIPIEQAALLEKTYGLTLDFIYLGRSHTLPISVATSLQDIPAQSQ